MDPNSSRSSRYEVFSYFASQVIRKHRASIGDHKWIALTGNSHANTYRGVPGLAELEGAIGVRVSDTATGSEYKLKQGIAQVLPGYYLSSGHSFLKNDYWLEVHINDTNPGINTAPHSSGVRTLTPEQTAAALEQPGVFIFQNLPSEGAQIVHRSRSGEIVRTTIQTTADGQLFVERPSWAPVHQKRYRSLEDMERELGQIGMSLRHIFN